MANTIKMKTELTAVVSPDKTLNSNELTKSQHDKFAYLREYYSSDEARLKLTQLIEPRGPNSWKAVNEKLDSILRADFNQNHYDDVLYDNFVIDCPYTSADIIAIVGAVRRDCGLPPYISSLKRNCEHDFWRLFIVQSVYQEVCCEDGSDIKLKRTLTGHIPRFRLKPEED